MISNRAIKHVATAVSAGFCGACLLFQGGVSAAAAHGHRPTNNGSDALLASVHLRNTRVCAFSTAATVPAMKESFASEFAKLPAAAKEVVHFWFPDVESGDSKLQKFWFAGGDATDDEIRSRFGDLLEEALAGGA